MESVIEQQRTLHEEIERIQQAIVRSMSERPRTSKEKTAQEHRISKFLTRIQLCAKALKDLYDDEDGSRKKEMDAVSGATDFSEFYRRLKNIKDYHRRNPTAVAPSIEKELATVDLEKETEELDRLFTGEEQYGRYLDLHQLYLQYINMKGMDRINYFTFIDKLDQFDEIPSKVKTSVYDEYLQNLLDYLGDFIRRSQPLLNVHNLDDEARAEFDHQWKSTASESDHLYCKACLKHFAKDTVFKAHLTGKKHVKAQAELDQAGSTEQVERSSPGKQRAWCEFLIKKYLNLLHETRVETKGAVERKQALTVEELDARNEEQQEVVEESEEDEDERLSNPLKLPLGWDGKPIPYWLYKMYGLGIEYPCEICGNYIYMGRQNFDRHFAEWRHIQGLKCLGIPNLKQFNEITLIKDAQALWLKIQHTRVEREAQADAVEEFEDAHGNVFNKKTYEDLKRQGLL